MTKYLNAGYNTWHRRKTHTRKNRHYDRDIRRLA